MFGYYTYTCTCILGLLSSREVQAEIEMLDRRFDEPPATSTAVVSAARAG